MLGFIVDSLPWRDLGPVKADKIFFIILVDLFWSNLWNSVSFSLGMIPLAVSSTVTILPAVTGPLVFTRSNSHV